MENNRNVGVGNADLSNRLVQALQVSGQTMQSSMRFTGIQSSHGKVDFVTELISSFKLFPKYIKNAKDNERSLELRNQGNKLFCLKKDEEALETYTNSVAVAETKSETLALAYANRSAVFFKLNLFEECLQDIERAFQNNYPESLKPKLLERKEKSENLKSGQEKFPYHQAVPTIPKENMNPLIECASDLIEIMSDTKVGRHIVATRDIEIGDVIAVEQVAFSLLTERKWCHCHHCLVLCYCLIPCESCTQALFCSAKCKNDSKTYHDFECPILSTIYSLDLNSCRILPIRIAILMKNHYKDLEKNNNQKSDGIYRSGRYKEIHNLVTNMESRSTSNLFERVTTAALFYHLIKNYTDFFKDEDVHCENAFKSLVLHHLQTMACNFHAIDDLERDSKSGVYELTTIGAGAYSFLSLFNHSCAPNVHRTSYGTTIVLSATQAIKKGEQLYENYGFHYGVHTKSERQAELKKQYFFDCECRACKNDWGTYDTLPVYNCDVGSLMMHYEKLANADLNTAKEIESDVWKAARMMEKYIPSKNYCEIEELLKQCSCIYANVRRSLQNENVFHL